MGCLPSPVVTYAGGAARQRRHPAGRCLTVTPETHSRMSLTATRFPPVVIVLTVDSVDNHAEEGQ
jgi:hypothetical protein